MNSTDEQGHNPSGNLTSQRMHAEDEIIDLRDIFRRIGRGLGQILGLALLGGMIAVVAYLVTTPWRPISTSTRVVFSFPGIGKGQYPDKSMFQPDDLRAPEVITEALNRQGLGPASELQSQIRGALDIEGVVSPDNSKERERLRITGQPLPFYIPDEYIVTLSLPRNFPLSKAQRGRLLSEIVSVYRENFQNTYANTPAAFGDAFNALHNADYSEYEKIFNAEIANITAYLTQQVKQGDSFRSATTNLSFKELLEQTQFFAQTRLNEILALIDQGSLSQNRALTMEKMAYSLRIFDYQERHALEDEKVVRDLLTQTQAQTQAQNYVLGTKSQVNHEHSDAPALDQGLIDSLIANDPYNFLVRRALDAGLQLKLVQAEKAQLLERFEAMKSAKEDPGDIAEVQKLLAALKPSYEELIANIRQTQTDFAHQQFANAIRITDVVQSSGMFRTLMLVGVVGCFLGFATGMGLSLLGIYIGSTERN